MDKKDLRKQLMIDLIHYYEYNHSTTLTPQKKKKKYFASGKQKKNHFYSTPINRPTQNWDLIPTKLG